MELAFADFKAEDKGELLITHLPTGFAFKVAHLMSSGRSFLNTYYTPDNSGLVAVPNRFKSAGAVENWETAYYAFKKWLGYIKEEYTTSDLWAEATKTANLFAPSSEHSDDKFTRSELTEVQDQLRLLQLSFTQAALPDAAKQKLIELTETAAVKAEGFTRKDWQSWFIGALISHIAEAVLNSEQIHNVYTLVKAAFRGLFLH